jgi:hypothetical protein
MWWLIIIIVVVVIVGGILARNYETNKQNERGEAMKQRLTGIENFTVSRKVDGFGGFYIFAIDETNEKIGLVTETTKQIVSFSDIIGVELIEDGNTISKKSTTRTIGGAIVGGVLAGGVGTIVGGLSGGSTQKNKVSSLSVKILLRSLDKPSLFITCFDSRTMTTEHKASLETDGKLESYIYKIGKKNADDIKDLVSVIIDRTDNKTEAIPVANVAKPSNSIADELMKLNELKEKGILTEDEFTLQKNKILN